MINTTNIRNKSLKENIEKVFYNSLINEWYIINFYQETNNINFISLNIKNLSGKIITNNAIERIKENLLELNYICYGFETLKTNFLKIYFSNK